MSPAALLRLAGLVSVAAGVLLVVTQLVGALAFVVVDADPVRAGTALVEVNGLLTLLAVYLLVGLVGLYAWQSAASGTLGLVGSGWRCSARCCWRVPSGWRSSRCRVRRARRRRWMGMSLLGSDRGGQVERPSALTLNLLAAAGLGVTATGSGDQRIAFMSWYEPVHAHGDCLPVSRRAGFPPHPPPRGGRSLNRRWRP
jgi:hypothetical protein